MLMSQSNEQLINHANIYQQTLSNQSNNIKAQTRLHKTVMIIANRLEDTAISTTKELFSSLI